VLDQRPGRTHARTNSDIISDSLRLAWVRRGEAELNKRVHEIVANLDLDDVAHVTVSGPAVRHPEARGAGARARADPKSFCSTSPPAPQSRGSHLLGDLIGRIRDERKVTILLSNITWAW